MGDKFCCYLPSYQFPGSAPISEQIWRINRLDNDMETFFFNTDFT